MRKIYHKLTFAVLMLLFATSVFAQNTCTGDAFEPNDSMSVARPLGALTPNGTTSITNVCLTAGDNDWFSFSAGGANYFAKVIGFSASTLGLYGLNASISSTGDITLSTFAVNGVATDTKLYLYNANGAQLAYNDDAPGGVRLSTIVYNPNTPTTTLTLSMSSFAPLATGGNMNVGVTSNASWTINNSNTWIGLSPLSGTGNGTFNVTAAVNAASTSRTGTFTVTGGGQTRTFSVTQAGQPLNCTDPAEPNNTSLTSTALGSITQYINSTFCLSPTGDQDWFSFDIFGTQYNLLVRGFSSNSTGTYGLNIGLDSALNVVINTFATPNGTANTDTYIALYNANGVQLAFNDDIGGGNFFSRVVCNPNAAVVSLTPNFATAPNAGGTFTTTFNVSNGTSWTATSSSPWITISPSSGVGTTLVTISVAASSSLYTRGGSVNFVCGTVSASFRVTQMGVPPALSVSPSSLNFTGAGGALTSNVITAGAWTISGVPAWATASAMSGSGNGPITFTTTANPNSTYRTAVVTVSGGGMTRTIYLCQAGIPFVCNDPAEPNDASSASTALGAIASPFSNNTYCLSAGDYDWFSFSIGSTQYFAQVRGFSVNTAGPYGLAIAMNNGDLVVNTFRSATGAQTTDTWLSLFDANGVLLAQNDDANGSLFSYIRYNLSAAVLVATPSSVSSNDIGGTFTVAVTAPAGSTWTASTSSTWFQVNAANGVLTIVVSANSSPSSRTGVVIVSDGTNSTSVNVTQSGAIFSPALTVSPSQMSFQSAGGSMSASINTACSWSVIGSPSWITVGSMSGTGISRLNLIASANTATTSRSGQVTISACGSSRTIYVTQAAYTVPVPPPANDFACNAIVLSVDTICNVSPTFSNAGATIDSITRGTCMANATSGDVWFSFTVPASGQFTVSGVAGTMRDGVMSIYTGTSCQQLTYAACNDDNPGSGLLPLINSNSGNYAPGSTVWVRYWGFGNLTGTFGVCVRDGIFAMRAAANNNTGKGNGLTGETSSFTAYPNPSADAQFNIVLDNQEVEGEASLQLIDLQGRVIAQMNRPAIMGENVYRFDNVSELANGIYIVRMQVGDKSLFTRVTISK